MSVSEIIEIFAVSPSHCSFIVYLCYFSRVVCKCGFCGSEKQALSDWERHTGSKARNWKTSVKVKGSMLPLEQWVCTLVFLLKLFCSYIYIYFNNNFLYGKPIMYCLIANERLIYL